VATIQHDVVEFADGPRANLTYVGDNEVSVDLKGLGTLLATYETGKLVWNDGDAWQWAGPSREPQHDKAAAHVSKDSGTTPVDQTRSHPETSKRPYRVRLGAGGGAGGNPSELLPERRTRGSRDPTMFPSPGNFYFTSNADSHIESPMTIAHSKLQGLACSWNNCWGGWHANAPDDEPLIRMLIPDSNPRVFVIEINSPRTSNMLDNVIADDLAQCFEAALSMMTRKNGYEHGPMSYVYQGSGPHFCPGGNPMAWNLPGTTLFETHSYAMATNVMRFNQLGIPGCAAIHGAAVGGGAAQTLNTNFRCLEARSSVSFGNLSRGMVPIMLLSKHIPAIDYATAVSYYLTDDTYAPIALYKAGYGRQVVKGNAENKAEALQFAKRLATTAQAGNLVKLRAALNQFDHHARECVGITFATSNEGHAGAALAMVKAAEERNKTEVEEPKGPPEIKVKDDPSSKDDSLLKFDVPVGKTVLEMKKAVAATWSLRVEDIMLMNGSKELQDAELVPEKVKGGAIKLVIKDAGYSSTDYGEDYDYDEYDWEDDYDYDYDYEE
jgi:enoyl-CoA hydratase/carnithine racemase